MTLQPIIIPGFSGYFGGSDGYIYSAKVRTSGKKRGVCANSLTARRRLKGRVSKRGYYNIGIMSDDHKVKTFRVNRLIALAFYGPCPEGYEVDHINHITTDNRSVNLQYLTSEDNRKKVTEASKTKQRIWIKGKWKDAEYRQARIADVKKANTKYSDEVCFTAVKSVLVDKKTQAAAALLTGVPQASISMIIQGRCRLSVLEAVKKAYGL